MTDKLPSARFRRQLKDQLPLLQSEGLITPQQTQTLTERYRLSALNSEATNTLLMTIYIIGSVLIGIGIISFIAAHWDDIGRDTKIIMLVSAMLVVHIAGFCLWQIRDAYPKLGHTLVLLGTLIFGANISLIAQIFHIHENAFNGFFAWSVGAVVIAYALRSVPNAVLAVVTFGIYAIGNLMDNSDLPAAGFSPLIAMVLFVPFIYYTRSGWVLVLTLLLLAVLIPCNLTWHDYMYRYYSDFPSEWLFSIGLALAGFLFFSWGMLSRQKETSIFISAPAWMFGVLCSSVMIYLCSFFGFCQELTRRGNKFSVFTLSGISITAGIVLAISVGLFLMSIRKRSIWILTALQVLIAAILAMVIALPLFPYTIAFVANLLFLLMIILLFCAAFTFEDRRVFWAAVLMAALLILSRTLEYETELLIKAVIFTACGVGLIVAGVLFERFLKSRRAVK
jgi:hypothetical protein